MKIYEIGTGYTSIPAKMGAATEIVVEELTKSMIKLGQDVEIVDIKDKNRKENNLPITEVYMPQFFSSTDTKLGIVHKLKRVLYSISLTLKLQKLIKKASNNEVFLHFHNQYNLYFFLKLTPKKLLKNVKLGYTVHSYVWFGEWNNIKDVVRKRYFQEVYCCQHADRVFVLNDIIRRMLVEHCNVNEHNIKNVINGVNTDIYNEKNIKTDLIERKKQNIGLAGKDIVLQVGSVCDRKNQLDTLKMLIPLMRKNNNIAFVYAGGIIDSVYAEQIQNEARKWGVSDRVVYAGEVSPGAELALIYGISKVCFMNSKSEAFALVIAEALSLPRPIFINEMIMSSLAFWGKNEGRGIIRIKDSFENDLTRLLEDKEYYNQMTTKGRNFIIEEYSWDVATEMYLENMI